MKNKETLEEAGLKHCDILDKFPALINPLFSFKEGAKWMQERMYSEEDLKEAYSMGRNNNTIEEFKEKFKKK